MTAAKSRRGQPGAGSGLWPSKGRRRSDALWRSEVGLTLIETLLTLAILGIVAAAFAYLQSNSLKFLSLSRQEADLRQNLQFGLDTITRELRQAQGVTVGASSSRVSYTDRDGREASFYLDTARQELHQRLASDPVPDRVIAGGITGATFLAVPGPSPLLIISLTGSQGDRSGSVEGFVAVRAP